MKSIKLARSSAPAAVTDSSAVGAVERRQLLIIILWIIAAWMFSIMVTEVSVLGAEPASDGGAHRAATIPRATLLDCWNKHETEFALLHGDSPSLQRLYEAQGLGEWISAATLADQRSSLSLPATVMAETAVTIPATASDVTPRQSLAMLLAEYSQHTDGVNGATGLVRSIQTAFAEESAAVTWQQDLDDIEAKVDLVAHGSRSLITPVHIHQVKNQGASASLTDRGASDGRVSYVETDTQFDTATTGLESVEVAPMQPSKMTENIASVADDVASPRTTIVATTEPAVDDSRLVNEPTSILRSRPPLLSVTTDHRSNSPSNDSGHRANESSAGPPAAIATIDNEHQRKPSTLIPSQTAYPAAASAIATTPTVAAAGSEIDPSAPVANVTPNTHSAPTVGAVQKPLLSAPANGPVHARLAATWPFETIKIESGSGVTLNVDNADVRSVFEMLARGYKMNILVAPDVEGLVTANVDGLTPEQTLRGIVKMCGLSMQNDDGLIYIYPSDNLPFDARQLRVFPLDFARAVSLEPAVQGLLSPVGNAYTSTISDTDTMQTQESIVVVDIPEVIAQVENYVYQADHAPRQVLIEARVLEVELTDDMVHGVDFDALLGADLEVGGFGFADPVATAANPRFFAKISGKDISGVLDLLETTTDSKTLASPRVQVINGQHARIQVGQQLGFTVATVTQTSTIQDVQFLETGVVLNVTPTISRDNRIMMKVKPEVSDGEINPATLLPEEQTREVETSVLLDNHQGVIIGGLIQERDRTVIKKLPWLGDVRHVGKFFQRREAVRSRSEIIVALIPHIVESCVQDERSLMEYDRVQTPLLQGALQRTCRPWEPRLPDRTGEERHMDVNQMNRRIP